jgi:hypothetical protein
MQEYDVALKLLLQGSAKLTMRELTGTAIEKWLDVELPKVQNLRADLLGETADGSLVHLELQSRNDPIMPLRMAEYCLGVLRLFGRFPNQVLLYVGEAPLRMDKELRGPNVQFQYGLVDIRGLDGDRLLDSADVGDNIIAILARLRDHKEAVRRIVEKITGSVEIDRETALHALLILAGLRGLEEVVEEEARKVPILNDILDNKVLGREFKKGLQEGRQKGLQEGRQEGLQEGERKGERKGEREGERKLLRLIIERRFGPMPGWAEERLASRSTAEMEDLSVRVQDAPSIEDLLR